MRKVLKQRWLVIALFMTGALELVLVHQTFQPDSYINYEPRSSFHSIMKADGSFEPISHLPEQIVVLGDHESGADKVVNVLSDAFEEKVVMHRHITRRSLLNAKELESIISSQTDNLWLVVVRSPCEWADAMIERKRHVCQNNNILQNTQLQSCNEIDESYNSEWIDWQDTELQEEIITSDTQNAITYQNMFEMRRLNLLITQQIIELVPQRVKIVRFGEFELNPNALVSDLIKEYNFAVKKQNKSIPINFNPLPSLCLAHNKWKDAQQLIDWKIEGYFGHHRLECHLCHGDTNSVQDNVEAPSKIYLLGERNSGTTFVSNTLAKAFDPTNSMGSTLEKFASGVPVLLHKHMFRHDLLNATEIEEIKARTDILWVLVVRSPCDWAEGMFRKPYHLCPPKNPERCGPESSPFEKIWMNQNSLIGTKLLDFFTTFPWADWAESVPFLRSNTHHEGGEQVSISKPSLNYTYDNVFSLRKHKLEIMKQIVDAVPRNVKLVRLKEIERSPEKFIQDIATEFKLPIREGYEPQVPSIVTHSTTCLTPPEWEAAEAGIDWELDGEFGFSPFDCRMCYGYTNSVRLYDRIMESKKVQKILEQPSRLSGKRRIRKSNAL